MVERLTWAETERLIAWRSDEHFALFPSLPHNRAGLADPYDLLSEILAMQQSQKRFRHTLDPVE
jgi:hypothetical protein